MPVDFSAEREGLEAWLSAMWLELEVEYPEDLPDDFPFDFDRRSLVELEEFLVSEFVSPEALRVDENREFIDRTARYLGETLRKNFKGEWQVGTGLHEGLPVVAFPESAAFPVSPFNVINMVLLRRSGVELTRIFDGLARVTGTPSESAGDTD